jgi:hypothetical protein
MSAQRRTPPPQEPIGNRKPRKTRSQRFMEVVPRRMKEIRKRLDDLGNCAGSNYQYSPEQARAVARLLREWVETTAAKFEHNAPALSEVVIPPPDEDHLRRGKDPAVRSERAKPD